MNFAALNQSTFTKGKSVNDREKFEIWRNMHRIRAIEERIAIEYSNQEMRCPTHLSIGQELVPAVVARFLSDGDYAVSTHRGHAHFIAKGGGITELVGELFGKRTGCSKGIGGSMHLADAESRFMGTSAIVGNSIPVGVGLAYASVLNEENSRTLVFFGEGASEEGVFYESLNFAVLHNLPIVFICENNSYSVYSDLSERRPDNFALSEVVRAMGAKVQKISHGDLPGLYQAFGKIFFQERQPGCHFIEIETYRYLEHCGPNNDDHLGYRDLSEVQRFTDSDPLTLLEAELAKNHIYISKIEDSKSAIKSEIDDAFSHARAAPFPSKQDLGYLV